MESIVDPVKSVRAGDRTEFDRLFTAVNEELRRLARHHLRRRKWGLEHPAVGRARETLDLIETRRRGHTGT